MQHSRLNKKNDYNDSVRQNRAFCSTHLEWEAGCLTEIGRLAVTDVIHGINRTIRYKVSRGGRMDKSPTKARQSLTSRREAYGSSYRGGPVS